jgi:hypothetical protein
MPKISDYSPSLENMPHPGMEKIGSVNNGSVEADIALTEQRRR